MDGRYHTVSIGAETDGATCSICGKDMIKDGFCGHWPGETYDGEKAFLLVGNVWFQELSFVNVPADQDAMVVSIQKITDTKESFESFDYGIYDKIKQFKKDGMSEMQISESWKKLTHEKTEETSEKTSTLEKLIEAHDVLHTLWSISEYNWDKDKIKKWHEKVSQQLVDDYEYDHKSLDNLDS